MSVDAQNDIHERIGQLVDHFCKGNKTAFGRETDILPGVLASIIGGRKSKPSFELLQKMLGRYPTIDANWLVMGRGAMLQGGLQSATVAKTEVEETLYATREQLQELDKEINRQRELFEAYKHDISEAAELAKVYKIVATHPTNRMLSERLGVNEEEARELVLSGQIRSKYIGKDNDRARRNGVSYLVSEAAVREFLGDAHS